ncbi:hypothetical protein EHQ96_02325 [Leptospira levettii]|uniref:Uncharacterized protein n=1 Tax=Leptospira levettii TaxID=2023178 RepID=A0A5F2DD17_9LEPT|nr:hypothetical protein [Leptospira levettii]PKA28121.1 hypothetical protein CH381_01995 [Leptospira sp. mixed culture ATI2-C-A1]MCW7467425.1 hypothetical protein [Leptospira levettii]MCW7509555.1 hypothetical protein [Leptospira levettii]MCW7513147.1 hypothetical protein [Leptospira levettii]MCW7516719.1 hypothetical protein [Leptospira levettii]
MLHLVRFFLFLLVLPCYLSANPGTYEDAAKLLPEIWETKYPLPYGKLTRKDPLNQGIRQISRKKGKYWVYNFEVFMPKYERKETTPVPKQEGRNIHVFFFWNPGIIDEPHRIELGEPHEGK